MGRLIAGPLVVVQLALYFGSFAAGIYWLIITVQTARWFWLVAGVLIPPVGVIGGAFAWFGLIFEADPALVKNDVRDGLVSTRTMMTMLSGSISKCDWREFTTQDKRAARVLRDNVGSMLREQHGVTAYDLSLMDSGAEGTVRVLECSDNRMRENFRKMLTDIKARYGEAYNRL